MKKLSLTKIMAALCLSAMMLTPMTSQAASMAAPADFTATANVTDGETKVELKWSPVNGANRYHVYTRYESSGGWDIWNTNEIATAYTKVSVNSGMVQIKVRAYNKSTGALGDFTDAITVKAGEGIIEETGEGSENAESENPYYMIGNWTQDPTGYYFQKDDGTLPVSTWGYIDGKYYYFNDISQTVRGWQTLNEVTYYFPESTRQMQEGWLKLDGSWYYFIPGNGAMVKDGWQEIEGVSYYFDENGKLLTNTTTPDGVSVDGNGAKAA